MIPSELIKKIRGIEIKTNKIVDETMAGAYHSVFKGRGMEFDEVRPYQPGDEIRTIDWNVSARMNNLFVKRYIEERELTVMILADMSGSQQFGTVRQTKAELMAEVSSMLAFSAIKNNDRIGLLMFTDRVEKYIPPKKGRKHVLRVISEILAFKPSGRRTSISEALKFMSHVQKRKSVVFLISDFNDTDFEKELKTLARRHDLILLVIEDQFELEPGNLGVVLAEDPESGARGYINLGDWRFRRAYGESAEREAMKLDGIFKTGGIENVRLRTGGNYILPLVKLFKSRRARRAEGR